MQDYLELGAESRMNSPGILGGNWTWRAKPGFADDELAAYIRTVTERYGRL
jgi:4-alpha-glucanotransferase